MFQVEMKRFTAKIIDMMKQEKLYASQGGPIILSQVNFICLLNLRVFSFKVYSKHIICVFLSNTF